MSSHVRHSMKLIVNTGNYSSFHIDHEVQLEIPNGDMNSPEYAAVVKEAQAKVDKMVMKHQLEVRDKINALLDAEAKGAKKQ